MDVPPPPFPMQLELVVLPLVAVTFVTPFVIVIAPHLPHSPLPMPVPKRSPVAVMVPPEMVISPHTERYREPLPCPQPMPAPFSPPLAVIVPSEILILPQMPRTALPMPAPNLPPWASSIVPPEMVILSHLP